MISAALFALISGAYVGYVKIRNTLTELTSKVKSIESEVHTNGGASLKDAVIRVEERQAATADKLDDHLRVAAYQQGRMDKLIEDNSKK